MTKQQTAAKTISLLGSTGSIGTQTLTVCREQGYRVAALAASSNVALLERQARQFQPELVAIADKRKYPELKTALADTHIRIEAGAEGVCQAAALRESDTVLNAIVGIAGLRPTLAALEAGKDVALANKETLITGGSLVMEKAKQANCRILPVDSEHSAIWQCLQAGRQADVARVLLTASGGPFYGKTREELRQITVAQALSHPNWAMGAKITIDSATLMNKGLEFIEAMWLFDLRPEQIEVIVHRQSVVHSAVEFADGAVIAQMGVPDMRGPIQYALTVPQRRPIAAAKPLSLTDYGALTFEKPDRSTFVCLDVCIRAAEQGGLLPCVANGANEAAVALFLKERLPFLQIGELVAGAVEEVRVPGPVTLEQIEQADQEARAYVRIKTGS